MALLNCDEAKKRFQDKLAGNFYSRERSKNTEVVYVNEKQKRDTQAVEEFAESELFQELFENL